MQSIGQFVRGPGAAAPSDRGGIQSVERAIALLQILARSEGGISLKLLAAEAGLNPSTCHHLLATLVSAGFAAQVPEHRTYVLGAAVLGLGHAFLGQVDLPRRGQPFLTKLSEETGEAAHLAGLQGDHVVTLAKVAGSNAVRVDTATVGRSEPPHATATGKAMLAWLPEDQWQRILSVNGLTRFTPATMISVTALSEDFRHVRRNGFALDREEFQPGVVCVGAAIRDHTGGVIGAISASAPAFRTSVKHLAVMRTAVVEAARQLSAEFGGAASLASDKSAKATPAPSKTRRRAKA